MKKPIILTVDDDQDVLQAISRDLRHGFGEHFRIIRAESGERALDVLRQVKLANESVALMLVDQRMPGLTGTEFLTQARQFFPNAKKALLTAYADTDAAITAINDIHLDHYLVKPWDPPEQRLFPVIDDLLDDWMASYTPDFDGIRLLGHRWSPESHLVRDFLARNQVPFRWMDIEGDKDAQEVLELTCNTGSVSPVLVYADGTVQVSPTLQEIAEKIGLRGHAEVPVYDLVIVGAGPAGLAAAVYGASEGLKTIVVEREAAGGQAGMSSKIENYLGFPAGLSGGDLSRRAMIQARRFGAAFMLTQEVAGLENHDGVIGVTLADGAEIRALSVIIATGVSYRRLDAPGVADLTGRGVYYGAAMTESSSVQGEDVYIVGGANSAGQAAMYFSTVCKNVTLLVRGSELSAGMSHYLSKRIESTPNIHVRYHTEVCGVDGTDHLESIMVRDIKSGETEAVSAVALFVFIGAQPHTEWLDGQVARDEKGFILTGLDATNGSAQAVHRDRDPFLLETSVPGVFAAGDVRHGSGKRVATAVGEGSTAVISVWQHRARLGL